MPTNESSAGAARGSPIRSTASAGPHSRSRLAARFAKGQIRVEVTDEGSGFTPQPRDPANSDRGYGLYLLEQQASAWGVDQSSGNTVWFELSC